MPINENEITKEQIYKAMQCNTADELRGTEGVCKIRRVRHYPGRGRGIPG